MLLVTVPLCFLPCRGTWRALLAFLVATNLIMLLRSAQGPEGRSELGCEQLGLFPGGEVAAAVDLVVVDELGIARSAQLRGAWYCSNGNTVTATGSLTPLTLKKPPLYSQ